jgi:hypothetical protein
MLDMKRGLSMLLQRRTFHPAAAFGVVWLLLGAVPAWGDDVVSRAQVAGTWVLSDGKGITMTYELRPDGTYGNTSVVEMPTFGYTFTIREDGRYDVERDAITFRPSTKVQTTIDGPKSTTHNAPVEPRTLSWAAGANAAKQPCLLLKDAATAAPSAYCRPAAGASTSAPLRQPGHYQDAANGAFLLSLLLSPILAGLTSAVALSVYRRKAEKEARSGSGPHDASTAAAAPSGTAAAAIRREPKTRAQARQLFHDLMTRPWRAASAFALGGAFYCAVMATAFIALSGPGFRPVAWTLSLWVFAWPIVLTLNIVAAATRRMKLRVLAFYALGMIIISAVALAMSPAVTIRQIGMLWVLENLPPTVLMLLFLNRAVRAVGPLLLALFLIVIGGSQVAFSLSLEHAATARAVRDVIFAMGAGSHPIAVMNVVGLLVLTPVWWLIARWICRRYDRKQISDESIAIDALWLVFLATCSGFSSAEAQWWILAAAIAFPGYKIVTVLARRYLRARDEATSGTTLLLLRSYSVGKDSGRLFDALEKYWRRVGSINMIVGADLSRRTIEPHEFLDFLTGKLARRFITGAEPLARRLAEMDTSPDADGRFRVNDFFCHEDTWQLAASTLVAHSDVVLMDLRGFSERNAGCLFEIREIARLVPLHRVVFLVDRRTDEPLLRRCLVDGGGVGHARMVRLRGIRGAELRRLFATLAAATIDAERRVDRPSRARIAALPGAAPSAGARAQAAR